MIVDVRKRLISRDLPTRPITENIQLQSLNDSA